MGIRQAVVFSEGMRDVDLFVSVATIGVDSVHDFRDFVELNRAVPRSP
jgi:hypothetical protein